MKNYFFAVAILLYGVTSFWTGHIFGFTAAETQIRQTIPNVANVFRPGQNPKTGDILIHGTAANPCNPATNLTCIDIFYNGSWVDFGMYATSKYLKECE